MDTSIKMDASAVARPDTHNSTELGTTQRLRVSWVTIAFFAIVISFADGFWVTSLQGAIGAIERREAPFDRWLRDSTLMLPLYLLAVLGAVLIARRWVGQSRRRLVEFGATALLIVVFSSAVAVAEVAASSAYDYHLQTRQLEQVHQHMGHTSLAAQVAPIGGGGGTCTGTCATLQATRDVHVRAVLLGSLVLLVTNLVVVAWVLALRGDRLWRRAGRTPTIAPAMMPEGLSVA